MATRVNLVTRGVLSSELEVLVTCSLRSVCVNAVGPRRRMNQPLVGQTSRAEEVICWICSPVNLLLKKV